MENSFKERIKEIKKDLGGRLIILTHHYQNEEIVKLGDYVGDSFGLSRTAVADEEAEYIVFCGVHFMAESAAILARPYQTVQIPDVEAGCWMADMADPVIVERSWQELNDFFGPNTITPVCYINSEAEIKAFCGRNEGTACTSSSAAAAFNWALDKRERIFFLPDEFLGRNTAYKHGIPEEEIVVWDPGLPLGGNLKKNLEKARAILWKGYCLVHTRFKVEQIEEMRATHPGARIVVHPECTPDVVAAADAAGSTEYIIRYVANSDPGDQVVIGTEYNMVHRLQLQYQDREILPLSKSVCPNMAKINLEKLCYTLEHLGGHNVVTVPEETRKDAVKSLERMLDLT